MRYIVFIFAISFLFIGCEKNEKSKSDFVADETSKTAVEVSQLSDIPPTTVNGCFDWGSAIRIEGINLSSGTCYFQITSSIGLTLNIDTWELEPNVLAHAHGTVISLTGVSAYTVIENPTAPSSKLQIQYSVCSKPYGTQGCESLCCEWKTCTITAYLYRAGFNEDGSPRFYLYKEPQTIIPVIPID